MRVWLLCVLVTVSLYCCTLPLPSVLARHSGAVDLASTFGEEAINDAQREQEVRSALRQMGHDDDGSITAMSRRGLQDVINSGALTDSNYVLAPVNVEPSAASSGFSWSTYNYSTVQGIVTLYIGVTTYPLNKFHFFPAPRKHSYTYNKHSRAFEANGPQCDGTSTTSNSAKHYGCLFAQNAGFFDMKSGACMGDVISKGKVINRAKPDLYKHVHFGLTRHNNYISGYITPGEVTTGVDGGFRELIQGSGWLVREGKPYINESKVYESLGEGFLQIKAPRNAIGHDAQGRLYMVQADGEEDIKLGLTLYEFESILLHKIGLVNAVNVDGGGSSTTVYKGEVIDKPTCHDTPEICERSVTTITCVME